jgi:hypothetical protein
MKVKELINILSSLDPDDEITHDGGDPIVAVQTYPGYYDGWYYTYKDGVYTCRRDKNKVRIHTYDLETYLWDYDSSAQVVLDDSLSESNKDSINHLIKEIQEQIKEAGYWRVKV